MWNLVPILMLRNDEYYIEKVVRAVTNVFPISIIYDTGSTDRTPSIVRSFSHIDYLEVGVMNMSGIGALRGRMQRHAFEKYKARWTFQIDGDELYNEPSLHYILNLPIPEGKTSGYTVGRNVMRLENGEVWYTNTFRRHCIFQSDAIWKHPWPYETPSYFEPKNPAVQFTWDVPLGIKAHHAHLHTLVRSPKDKDVFMRVENRLLHSMQPVGKESPEMTPTEKADL